MDVMGLIPFFVVATASFLLFPMLGAYFPRKPVCSIPITLGLMSIAVLAFLYLTWFPLTSFLGALGIGLVTGLIRLAWTVRRQGRSHLVLTLSGVCATIVSPAYTLLMLTSLVVFFLMVVFAMFAPFAVWGIGCGSGQCY